MYRSEYANESADSFKELYELHQRVRELEKELEAAKKSDEWISVKERLPENKGRYIVYMRGQEPFVSWFDGDMFRTQSTVPIEYPATHWMPLPEPPKEMKE